jgi:methyl-accepting chemotaxis protein
MTLETGTQQEPGSGLKEMAAERQPARRWALAVLARVVPGSIIARSALILGIVLVAAFSASTAFENYLGETDRRAFLRAAAIQEIAIIRTLSKAAVGDGDRFAALRALEDHLDRGDQSIIAIRASTPTGAPIFKVAQRNAREAFDDIDGPALVPAEPTVQELGDQFLVHTVLLDPAGRPVGGLEALVDAVALSEYVMPARQRPIPVAIVSGTVVALFLWWVMRMQIAAPFAATIRAMEDIAENSETVEMPRGGGIEFARIAAALRVFRERSAERIALAERSAEAEARAATLEAERRAAEAEAAREASEAESLRLEEAEAALVAQTALREDVAKVLLAALEGDFTVRLSVDGKPQEELGLRHTLNQLLAGIEEGLQGVIDVMADFENGRLSARVEGVRSGTLGRLQSSTNAMAEQLQSALTELSRHATGMLDDTSDLSASAEDLSRRTERTAGSLAETTSVLEQIVLSIASTASLAQEGRSFAETARADARQSDDIVQDAILSMQEIQALSERISNTLSVIDDIAFQTNLLALNAGVEAARAGDAGRGFAVVASEVRALAQRAAGAAQEIGDLITTSSEQIERGVQRVGRTSETLAALGDRIQTIGDRVGEIATAADAQATSMAEVNRAMSDIDAATQQNTAMFEEMTTANLSLKGAASEMLRLMDAFDHRNGDGDASMSAAMGKDSASARPDRRIGGLDRRAGLF